ncbi:MAG: preprotein translocase subunit SecG [bacterium]
METLLVIFQVLIGLAMVAMILVQKGAGATAGASFGAGASATVFGAKGSGSFLTRTTAVLATLFFAITFFMAVLASQRTDVNDKSDLGVMEGASTATEQPAAEVAQPAESDVPAIPVNEADAAPAVETSDDVPALPEETNAAEIDVNQAEQQNKSSEDKTKVASGDAGS